MFITQVVVKPLSSLSSCIFQLPAIRAAAQCYIELIIKESDNNVKLIVLDRLIALKSTPSAERVVQELVMDILRVLGPATSDLEVRYGLKG